MGGSVYMSRGGQILVSAIDRPFPGTFLDQKSAKIFPEKRRQFPRPGARVSSNHFSMKISSKIWPLSGQDPWDLHQMVSKSVRRAPSAAPGAWGDLHGSRRD